MTQTITASAGGRESGDILLSDEECVLVTIREIVTSLRGNGGEIKMADLEGVLATMGGSFLKKPELGGETMFEFGRVKFRLHSVGELSNEIEICFLSGRS